MSYSQSHRQSRNPNSLGIYVHVPFCGNACDYCAFYKEQPIRSRVDAWLDGIARELELLPFPRIAQTCYIGGGTPGILTARDLEKLCQLLHRANGGNAFSEFSIELAPATVKADKLHALRGNGVTRLSMGVQSFDAPTLQILGRRHSPKQIFAAYELMRGNGFSNINFDLIFAVPTENPARWERDLRQAIDLAPDHISAYCLILEENAPLLARLRQAPNFVPAEKSPEREAELYLQTWATLAAAGFAQYEVANHARGGKICQHNVNTWRMHEWLGYGPAAASQCAGTRFANPANLAIWLENLKNPFPQNDNFHANLAFPRTEIQHLSREQLFCDAIIFGLRMNTGIDLAGTAERFLGTPTVPAELLDFIDDLRSENYLQPDAPAGTLALSPHGLLVADAIAAEFLSRMRF